MSKKINLQEIDAEEFRDIKDLIEIELYDIRDLAEIITDKIRFISNIGHIGKLSIKLSEECTECVIDLIDKNIEIK